MDAVNEVKARLNIEDVIGEYVSLKRAGKNYKGLSPFTSEKTPSFVVSPEKQIWHDFSSGRGGDMFTFVQEAEGLDFKGALELLARKAGVDLDKFNSGSGKRSGPSKERLYEVNEKAVKFYQVQLMANQAALDYVAKKRAFTKQTILDFGLGYSPDSGDALVRYLAKEGFSPQEMQAAGLVAQRRGGTGDMFRGRIMIPLCDQFGKPVGFTARLLADNKEAPKYINTPATMLYDKSRHVYGLHLAKKAIQKEKFSVLVEGNLDVVSSHQAGVANVVATAGTALTEMQLKVLGRFSPDVRLAFDEDRAGLAATERAIPIAQKTGVQLSVVTIPSGKDPDELVRQDPKIWQQIITEPQYALDWLIDRYSEQLDITSAVGKRQFGASVLPVLAGLSNAVEQDHYVQKIAILLGVEPSAIREQMDKSKGGEVERRKKPVKKSAEVESRESVMARQEMQKVADRLLSLGLLLASVRSHVLGLDERMFVDESAKALFRFIETHPQFDGSAAEAESLQQIADYVKIITLQFEELYAGIDTLELQYEASRLKVRLVEVYVKDQKKQIISRMHAADESEQARLLQEVRELDNLLRQVKEK